jgi:putative hydrolase of the HAD superfamily
MPLFDVIAFDADDTLWHTERAYVAVQEKFAKLLALYQDEQAVAAHVYQVEMRNIRQFGYGIKSFTLSMIEAAVEISGGSIPSRDIQSIIEMGKDMLVAEVELLDHASTTVAQLAAGHKLMLVTKGDLQDQQSKIARSGLGKYFLSVEIVNEKTGAIYRSLLNKYALEPGHFLMVGNSLRSDILPVLEVGGQAVYIPYQMTWQHENAAMPAAGTPGFHQLHDLGQLTGLIEKLEAAG